MPTIVIPLPTGPTKRHLVELAYGNLGVAGYEFALTPEEVTDALSRLDALMYEWPYNKLGWVHRPPGEGEPDEQSGIPDEVTNAVAAGLALRIAAPLGRDLPAASRANLAVAVSTLYAYTASIPRGQRETNTIAGAGSEHTLAGPFLRETFETENPPPPPGP